MNGHCYWLLRKQGWSATKTTDFLARKSVADKNELLFGDGVNFNELPNWQKRGTGLWWEKYEKLGHNPLTGENVTTERRHIKVEMNLPMKDEYDLLIRSFDVLQRRF